MILPLYVDLIGFGAGALTTFSLFPEIMKTMKMKETRDISPGWLEMLAGGTLLWTVYGVFIDSAPVMAANFVSFLSALVMMYLKRRYK